ncbi:MAG: sugar transporter, partial [Thermomicrobiales bacterium]
LLAGAVADLLGLRWAIGVIGGLTLASGVVVAIVMAETLVTRRADRPTGPVSAPSPQRRTA